VSVSESRQHGRPGNVRNLDCLLCASLFIAIEQSSKPSTTNHRSSSMLRGRERHDQHIVEALVVALLMKTGAALSKSTPLHSPPDRD